MQKTFVRRPTEVNITVNHNGGGGDGDKEDNGNDDILYD
jgi:hypothetical protein